MTYRDVKLTLTLRNPESLTEAQRNALIDAAVAAVCIDGVLSPAETEMAGSLLASALALEPAASRRYGMGCAAPCLCRPMNDR